MGTQGTSSTQGSIQTCDADADGPGSCSTLDSYGNTAANALVAGGGFLWAGLNNGILWQCELALPNRCADFQSQSLPINSLAYDGQGTIYAAELDASAYGGHLLSCTISAPANSCTSVLSTMATGGVAAGSAGVFAGDDYYLYSGTTPYSNATAWSVPYLVYVPAAGLTGVGALSVQPTRKWRQALASQCSFRGPSRLRVTLRGPHAYHNAVTIPLRGKSGSRTVPPLRMLDPGTYLVKANGRCGKDRALKTITRKVTVRKDRTRLVKVA